MPQHEGKDATTEPKSGTAAMGEAYTQDDYVKAAQEDAEQHNYGPVKPDGAGEPEKPDVEAETDAEAEAEPEATQDIDGTVPDEEPAETPADEQAAQTAEAAQPAPTYDPAIVSLVQERMGLTASDLNAMRPEMVTKLVAAAARMPAQVALPGAKPAETQAAAEAFRFNLPADTYSEDFVRDVTQPVEKYLNDLTGRLKAVLDDHERRNDEEYTREVDSFFESQKETFGEVFGDKPLSELPENSPQVQARHRLVELADALYETQVKRWEDAGRKGKYPDFGKSLNAALMSEHPDRFTRQARAEVKTALAQKKKGFVHRPTHRANVEKPANMDDAATQKYTEALKKLGVTVGGV